jgi:hypothetical protein
MTAGGGTVAASTSVSVRPSPSAKQAYSEADVLGLRGDVSVTIEWTGPRALKLTVAPEAEVTAFRPKLDGLAVTWSAVDDKPISGMPSHIVDLRRAGLNQRAVEQRAGTDEASWCARCAGSH